MQELFNLMKNEHGLTLTQTEMQEIIEISKKFIYAETESGAQVPCSDGLYGAVQWINDKPILDGMSYFETKDLCVAYANRMGAQGAPPGINVRYTIIRLEKDV